MASAAAGTSSGTVAWPPHYVAPEHRRLTVWDVQHWLLHLLLGGRQPSWLRRGSQALPSPVVLVMLPGLDWQAAEQGLPHLRDLFAQVLPFSAKGTDNTRTPPVHFPNAAANTLLTLVSIPEAACHNGKRKQAASSPGAEAGRYGTAGSSMQPGSGTAGAAQEAVVPPAFFAATEHQLRLCGFPPPPTPDQPLAPGWVSTQQQCLQQHHQALEQPPDAQQQRQQPPCQQQEQILGQQQPQPLSRPDEELQLANRHDGQQCQQYQHDGRQYQEIAALDCEMCLTEGGMELVRATLVGAQGQALLDTLVLPEHPVVDFLTQYHGITPQALEGTTTGLANVQASLLQLVGPDTLLCGHSLENDLRYLKLHHPRILDTALLFPANFGLPVRPGLAQLAKRLLGQEIHAGAHDSQEDAAIALQLAQLKWRQGPTSGTVLRAGHCHLLDALVGAGKRMAVVGPREVLQQHAALGCEWTEAGSDAEAVAAVARLLGQEQEQSAAAAAARGSQLARPDFVLCSLCELLQYQEQRALQYQGHALDAAGLAGAVAAAAADEHEAELLQQLGRHLAQLQAALPEGALLLGVSGQGDTPLVRALEGPRLAQAEAQTQEQQARAGSTEVAALKARACCGIALVGGNRSSSTS